MSVSWLLLIISPIGSSKFELIVDRMFGWDELVEMTYERNTERHFNMKSVHDYREILTGRRLMGFFKCLLQYKKLAAYSIFLGFIFITIIIILLLLESQG